MRRIIIALLLFLSPVLGYCEQVQTFDKNKDGKIDTWVYRDDKGVPIKWVRDTNFDGKEDSWSFFKDGKAFLDEDDYNHTGKVNRMVITVMDSDNKKVRSISLVQKDADKNIFVENEDTGWKQVTVETKN